MSFGTFNLFNFYQQPNTGSYPTSQQAQNNLQYILSGGNGASGTVADFNWYFPYALEKVPTQVVQSQAAYYPLTVFSDTLNPAIGGQGLHWGQITTVISGDFWPDLNTGTISILFSGDFQPLVQDAGGMRPIFSGDFQGFPSGLGYISNLLSGDCTADNFSLFTFLSLLSGDFISDFNLYYIYTLNSGNIIKDNLSQINISEVLSGDFYSFQFDNTNINYGFNNNYQNGSGNFIYELSGVSGDTVSLTYALLTYSRGV